MLTDAQVVDICAATYDQKAQWDFLLQHDQDDDVYVGVKRIGGFDVVAFRGSVTAGDWLRDVDATVYLHPKLGGVHAGFSFGIDEAYDKLLPNLKQPIIVTGHSLGAARALLYSGLLAFNGIPISSIVVCGSPRPALAKLSEILLRSPISSYKNRVDPVTDVPVPPFVHPRSMIPLDVAPEVYDDDPTAWIDFNGILEKLDFMADHHIELYQKGIHDLEAVKA